MINATIHKRSKDDCLQDVAPYSLVTVRQRHFLHSDIYNIRRENLKSHSYRQFWFGNLGERYKDVDVAGIILNIFKVNMNMWTGSE
jgi:hypothetical protein